MLAEVVWNHSMASKESHLFLTCHMHHHTAKKAKGFADGFDRFWNTVEGTLQRHAVDFITGDFNMSLWQVCPQLRINHPPTTMLAWYGWKTVAGGSYQSVQQADGEDCDEDVVGATAPVVPGKARPVGLTPMHRSDSCGIFSLRKPAMVTRAMPDDAFENPDAELEEWMQGQGYPIESFLGGAAAVRLSLETPSGVAGMLPSKEKLTMRAKFDPDGLFFRSGAHHPLLVYVGCLSRRSPAALLRREKRMTGRDGGPQSFNRAQLMQAQGRGHRPGKAKGKGDANEEMGKGGSTHGRGKGPGIYEEQGKGFKGKGKISEVAWHSKGHEGKREKGKGYEGTGKSYEGKGNHGVQQGEDRDSRGAKGAQQQQCTREGSCEPGSTHDRGDESWNNRNRGWNDDREDASWHESTSGWNGRRNASWHDSNNDGKC